MNDFNDEILKSVVAIPIEKISANPYQPRGEILPDDVVDLMKSIKNNGLIQPVVLRKISNGFYEIIAGERRCRACMELGYKFIPAILEKIDDEKSAVIALAENVNRKNLNFYEEALAINNLIENFSFSQKELCEMLGKTQGAIANKLRVLKLPQYVLDMLVKFSLTERHARALLVLPTRELQIKACEYICKNSLNVALSEKYIYSVLDKINAKPKGKTIVFCNDVRIFVNTMKEAVSFMKSAGINVETNQLDDDKYINYMIKIPKSQGYKAFNQRNA